MPKILFKIIRYSGLPFFFRELIQRRKITILILHDITTTAAKQAFLFWKRSYNLISLQEYIDARKKNEQLPPKSLILTFDDGHKGNYRLLSLINELQIPVTIFLCSGIVGTNRHFWFLNNNIDVDKLKEMPDEDRMKMLKESWFSPEKEYAERQALSKEEVLEMKKSMFVDFQSHTITHPVLTKCSIDKASSEIFNSKRELEKKYKLEINGFAYPNGVYGKRETVMAKQAGYSYAVTADAGFNTFKTDIFKLKRLSVNDSENIDEIIVKSSGVWGIVKKLLRQ